MSDNQYKTLILGNKGQDTEPVVIPDTDRVAMILWCQENGWTVTGDYFYKDELVEKELNDERSIYE